MLNLEPKWLRTLSIYLSIYLVLDPLAFVPNTFYTRKLSIIYGLFQTPGLHTRFGLTLNRGLDKSCVKTVFYTKGSFTQNRVLHKHHVLPKKQRSCWVCANAVCGLKSSSFHGGRRNTPTVVKSWAEPGIKQGNDKEKER